MTVYSLPEAMDWNEDGKIDLIHSGKNNGYSDPNILLYINEGTETSYKYGTPINIESNGSPMYHVSPATPHIIDYNRDGNKDLMIGTSNGKIAYYENKGVNDAPVFGSPEYITHGPMDDDEVFVVKTWEGSSTAEIKQHFCDWNGDGYWDIIMGGGKSVMNMWVAYGKPPTDIEPAKNLTPNNKVSVNNLNGIFQIRNDLSHDVIISIFNARGSKVASNQKVKSEKTLSISKSLPKGVYFLRYSNKKININQKFIIK